MEPRQYPPGVRTAGCLSNRVDYATYDGPDTSQLPLHHVPPAVHARPLVERQCVVVVECGSRARRTRSPVPRPSAPRTPVARFRTPRSAAPRRPPGRGPTRGGGGGGRAGRRRRRRRRVTRLPPRPRRHPRHLCHPLHRPPHPPRTARTGGSRARRARTGRTPRRCPARAGAVAGPPRPTPRRSSAPGWSSPGRPTRPYPRGPCAGRTGPPS